MALTPDEYADRMETLAGGDFVAEFTRSLVASSVAVEAAAKINATTRPRVRTGRLRSSIRGRSKIVPGGTSEVAVGSNVTYARIQDQGGTVTGNPWLTIPVGPARTAAGDTRGSARDFPLFFQRTGRGAVLRHQRTGEVYFVLRRSVTIPATRYLERAAREEAENLRSRLEGIAVTLRLG